MAIQGATLGTGSGPAEMDLRTVRPGIVLARIVAMIAAAGFAILVLIPAALAAQAASGA
jgi:hypothetical protein